MCVCVCLSVCVCMCFPSNKLPLCHCATYKNGMASGPPVTLQRISCQGDKSSFAKFICHMSVWVCVHVIRLRWQNQTKGPHSDNHNPITVKHFQTEDADILFKISGLFFCRKISLFTCKSDLFIKLPPSKKRTWHSKKCTIYKRHRKAHKCNTNACKSEFVTPLVLSSHPTWATARHT